MSDDCFTTSISKKTCIIALSNYPTQMARRELFIPYIRLPYNIGQDEIATIAECLDADHVVIGIHNPHWWKYADHEVPAGSISLVTRLKELKKKVTIVLFGSPYSIKHFKNANAIILGYEDNNDVQQVVLDIITGMQKAQGAIPVKIALSQSYFLILWACI